MNSNAEGSSGSQSAEIRIDASRAPDAQARQRDLIVRLAQAKVADAIGLLMRSDRHRHFSLADLEWLLLPPLLLNQVMMSYVRPQIAKTKRAQTDSSSSSTETVGDLPPMAVAMVTWATVSDEVNAKLDAQLKSGSSYRLAPNEWKSGNIVRIIDSVGQREAIAETLTRLATKFPHLRHTDGQG